jgi:thioredoxin reductase (NADPH)
MQRVTQLYVGSDRLGVELSDSGPVEARAIVLATGASYRRLGVPALEALSGAGVYYGAPASEALAVAGRDVYVLGGANSGGQAALHLARHACRVTLLVRGGSLGAGMSHYLVRQVEASQNISVRLETEIVGGGGDGWLDHLVLRDRGAGGDETVEAQGLFVLIGARPRTEWLPPEVARDASGFVLTGTDLDDGHGWPLQRSPSLLETSVPGVLAAGDVRHGSARRVASAVGEGSVAIQTLHALLEAEAPSTLATG